MMLGSIYESNYQSFIKNDHFLALMFTSNDEHRIYIILHIYQDKSNRLTYYGCKQNKKNWSETNK